MTYIVSCSKKEHFYRDTRGEDYGGWSDIFTSSTDRKYATQYKTASEAQVWNEEFLAGDGVVIPL